MTINLIFCLIVVGVLTGCIVLSMAPSLKGDLRPKRKRDMEWDLPLYQIY